MDGRHAAGPSVHGSATVRWNTSCGLGSPRPPGKHLLRGDWTGLFICSSVVISTNRRLRNDCVPSISPASSFHSCGPFPSAPSTIRFTRTDQGFARAVHTQGCSVRSTCSHFIISKPAPPPPTLHRMCVLIFLLRKQVFFHHDAPYPRRYEVAQYDVVLKRQPDGELEPSYQLHLAVTRSGVSEKTGSGPTRRCPCIAPRSTSIMGGSAARGRNWDASRASCCG